MIHLPISQHGFHNCVGSWSTHSYHPLPGSQIERLAYTHPTDDDQRDRDAIVTMTGYIDDVEITYMAVPDDDDESDAIVASSP